MSNEIGPLSRRPLIRLRRMLGKCRYETSRRSGSNHPDKNRASVAFVSFHSVGSSGGPAQLPCSRKHRCSEGWRWLASRAAVRSFIVTNPVCPLHLC